MRGTDSIGRNKVGRKQILLLFFVAFIAEIVIGNFSTWRSLFNQPIDLKPGMQITGEKLEQEGDKVSVPSGTFQIEIPSINTTIQNLKVQIQLSAGEKLSYIVSLTDEGNAYPYNLPEKVVIPELEKTQYLNIYPYGKVSSLNLEVSIPEGSGCTIETIEANSVIPFVFEWVRFFCFFSIAMIIYCFRNRNPLWTIECKRDDKKQMIITIFFIVIILILSFCILRINPICIQAPWPHQRQYQELADALAKGQVYLDSMPSKELVEAPNPYDTIYLQANNIFYQFDYAYFKGRYYVYFGIVPVLLLYLPCLLITGHQLPNYLAFFCFYSLFVISVFALLREIVKRWFQTIPFLAYLAVGCLFAMNANYLFLLGRPDLYNVPIMAANAFTMVGIFCWLKALDKDCSSPLWLAAGSFAMALVVGCRPQMFLFSFLAIPIFWKRNAKERIIFAKGTRKRTIAFTLPYFIIAMILMYYNAARFGSVFDFGATYSLTSNDMTKRGFNISRLLIGFFTFFLQPPLIEARFPFLQHNLVNNSYMGKMITEFTYGGIITSNLFLWSTFFLGKARELLKSKNLFWMTLSGLIVSIIIAGFDINGAGILQRYTGDFLLGCLLTASILLFAGMEKLQKTDSAKWILNFLALSFLWNIAYGAMILFASGDTVNLANYRATLYYYVASLFSN